MKSNDILEGQKNKLIVGTNRVESSVIPLRRRLWLCCAVNLFGCCFLGFVPPAVLDESRFAWYA